MGPYVLGCRTFPLQERPFALDAPAITRRAAVIADYTMARNGHGDMVGRACTGHCAHCLGSADPARDVGVAGRFTRRNLAQGLPDLALKCRSANIKGQVDIDAR